MFSRMLSGFGVVVLWLVARGLGDPYGGGLFRISLCRPADTEICVSVHIHSGTLVLWPDRHPRCGTSRVKARGVVWREDGSAGSRRVMAGARVFAGKAVRVL